MMYIIREMKLIAQCEGPQCKHTAFSTQPLLQSSCLCETAQLIYCCSLASVTGLLCPGPQHIPAQGTAGAFWWWFGVKAALHTALLLGRLSADCTAQVA